MSFFTSPLVLDPKSMNSNSQQSALTFAAQPFLLQQLRQPVTLFGAQNLLFQNLNSSPLSGLPLTKKVKGAEPKTTTNVILQSSAENISQDTLSKNQTGVWKSPAKKDQADSKPSNLSQIGFTPRVVEPTKPQNQNAEGNQQIRTPTIDQQLLTMQAMWNVAEQLRRLKEQQEISQMLAKTASLAQLHQAENFGSPLSKASTDSRTAHSPHQTESSDSNKFSKDIKSNHKMQMEDFEVPRPTKTENKKSASKKSKQSARSNESRITRKRLAKQIEKLEMVTSFLNQPSEPKETGRRLNSLQTMKNHQEEEEQTLIEEVANTDMTKFLRCNGSSETRVGSDYQAFIPASSSSRPRRDLKVSWNPETTEETYQRSFVDKVENILGYYHLCDERAMKLLIRYNMDAEKALESVSKNKTYYKNLLSAECKKYVKELKKIN